MIQQDSQMFHLFVECRDKIPNIARCSLYDLFYYPLQYLSIFEIVISEESE